MDGDSPARPPVGWLVGERAQTDSFVAVPPSPSHQTDGGGDEITWNEVSNNKDRLLDFPNNDLAPSPYEIGCLVKFLPAMS